MGVVLDRSLDMVDQMKPSNAACGIDEYGVEAMVAHSEHAVWISVRGSSLLQLYDVRRLALLVVFDVASGCNLTDAQMVICMT